MTNVPQELTEYRNWVCWRTEERDSKLKKVPYHPGGWKASTTNPDSWSDFDEAHVASIAYDGLGFVFTNTPFAGVDLDHVLNGNELDNEAAEIVAVLNSYTERSPGGDGLHVIVRANLPEGGNRRGNVEMYDAGRYFTMTGDHWPGTPTTVEERQANLAMVHRDVFSDDGNNPPPPPNPAEPVSLDDRELIEKARNAKNGAKFERLWGGDTSSYPSPSEADLALCSELAFWTQGDKARIDRLFRQSGLMREKWNRHDYRKRTVSKALERAEFYAPGQNPPPSPSPPMPDEPQPEPKLVTYVADPTEIPPLPEGALLDPFIGAEACPWLDRYLEFSREWSPRSFDGFHEAVGLWLLSTIAARRVRVHFGKPRFTNLYIMLAGRTTVHAKSSATEIGRQLLRQCGLESLLASDQATPQAFIRSLARTELPANYDDLDEEMRSWAEMRVAFSAQRGWYFEEFGSGIEAMMRKSGIMADFRGVLRAFDDCPPTFSRETISRGIETVKEPYLALIGNLTPADLRPVAQAGSQLWGDGFLARFAFVTPPEDEVKQGRFPKGQRVIPAELMTPLVEWHRQLGVPVVTVYDVTDSEGEPTGEKRAYASPLPVETLAMSDPVRDAYYTYDHGLIEVMEGYGHTDLDGNYGRLGEKALRVAALFASLQGSETVELSHFAKAQHVVERWRLYTERIYEQVTRRDKSQWEEMEDKALDALKRWQGTEKYPDGMTAAQVARFVHGSSTNDMIPLLDGLHNAGVLEKHKPIRAERYYVPGVNGL